MADSSTTDWIQAIAAAISIPLSAAALIYVVKSLNAQTSVNQAQFDLLKIERNRANREIRPELHINPIEYSGVDSNPNLTYMCFALSTTQKAKGLCIEYLQRESFSVTENLLTGSILGDLNQKGEIRFAFAKMRGLPMEVVIRIHCKDIDGGHIYEDFILKEGRVLTI